MFTGIIDHTGVILSAGKRGDLHIAVGCAWGDLAVGESVAVNGVCLTVMASAECPVPSKSRSRHSAPSTRHSFTASLSAETLKCTAPRWEAGEEVNLERALKAGSDISGHFVTGHVDGVVMIKTIAKNGGSHILCLEAPREPAKFIAPKGSVSLDGVSLTVNKIEGRRFWVNIIPHTWKTTTLCRRKAGDGLNLEIDIIARYVERLLAKQG